MIRLIAFVILTLSAAASPAWAQPAKIFVASTGNDANDGGRATPKRSFQAAHNAVAAGGEIVVLDTAGYGAVTITKSVGVVVPLGVTGFVTSASGNGITINAGLSDIVSLSGLIVEGSGKAGVDNGIVVNSAAVVTIDNTVVRNFSVGIFSESSSLSTRVLVRGSAIGARPMALTWNSRLRAI